MCVCALQLHTVQVEGVLEDDLVASNPSVTKLADLQRLKKDLSELHAKAEVLLHGAAGW